MAAGDIIIPDGRLTPEILEKITSEVVNNIQTTSKDPGQYEEVNSLQGITSLPVFQTSGAAYKLVRVAISILRGVDGKEVHLQSTETHLQWRWTDGMWQNLIAWADLKGDTGDTPTFRTGAAGIEWKYAREPETEWKVLVTFEVLKLKFTDLTADQIVLFWRGVPEDVVVLFQKPATDAAAEVRDQMSQISQDVSQSLTASGNATKAANDAAKLAGDATTKANEATSAANIAAENADQKAGLADAAAGKATASAGLADEKASLANTAAENANLKAGLADAAAHLADTATGKADKATEDATNATKAAVEATGDANTAASLANEKAELALTAAGKADDSTTAAVKATQLAIEAEKAATQATGLAIDVATLADKKADLANTAAETATVAAERAEGKAGLADIAANRANVAAAGAESIVKGFQSDWNVTDPADPNYIQNKPEIPTLDAVPTGETLSYVNSTGTTVSFRIGDEVRVLEDGEYVFYRLYDLVDGAASWQESGSGTALPGNIYLQGANYYNDSIIRIKEGYINE